MILGASFCSEDVDSAAELSLEERHKVLETLGCDILGFIQKDSAVIGTVVD